MRIGLINQLHGRPGESQPTWNGILERARAAEELGFDIFVFEDAFLYRGESATDGVWESMTVAAALAASTSRIEIGQSVVNTPYRQPALLASMATSLDEISAGRYVLGMGAGNTPDSDYRALGIPIDHRYSRFAEAIHLVHSLLKEGKAEFEGEYYRVADSELVLRGPGPRGPRINIAAGGEKMLGLVARYADEWNWWGWDETVEEIDARFTPIIDSLDALCETEGRDPATLGRTLDLYAVVAPGLESDQGFANPVTGTADEITATILELGGLGFDEIRVDVFPKSVEALSAMEPVVAALHSAN